MSYIVQVTVNGLTRYLGGSSGIPEIEMNGVHWPDNPDDAYKFIRIADAVFYTTAIRPKFQPIVKVYHASTNKETANK